MSMRGALVVCSLLCMTGWTQAADFRSVGPAPVVMYDAPSRSAKRLYVASPLYPLEVIVNLEAWVKVRDHTGALSWIEKKQLSERRTVLVTSPTIDVLARPEEGAPSVLQIGQDVALELVEVSTAGWLRVRHDSGATGFVRANAVWGR